ncbi:hypothetical protein MLD38_026668 [Melastoma candidum]|uniref:Uncharacterized protein n=1 Tax=Melastoma candidum TaxID=119954 RepID=A0ACB9P2I2_9MYRT|nr:hypothetical protein MLD38_026668 [Melastoma candidum]
MGSSSMIKLLFTLAIVVVTSFLPRNPVAVPIKRSDADTHVYIYNELDLGPTLTVHCWSKDDDLGEQDLPPKFSWDFSFGLDAFGRTRFDCTFEWDDEVHKFLSMSSRGMAMLAIIATGR